MKHWIKWPRSVSEAVRHGRLSGARGVGGVFDEVAQPITKPNVVNGKSFRESMVDPLALILSSPRFLYLLNPDIGEEKTTRALDAVSLANRLAAFLWSGPPDEELMKVAVDGSLLNEAILLKQTDRMLDHPRAREFYRGFISQWMRLKRLDSVGLNSRFLLHFTDAYILSAKQEPVEFFKTLVEENLSSTNLIDSDFVTIDGVLAAKYGFNGSLHGRRFSKGKPSAGLAAGWADHPGRFPRDWDDGQSHLARHSWLSGEGSSPQ